MPRNGSGQYSPPGSTWSPANDGTLATSSDWNALLEDVSSSLTQSVSRDGQSPMTGNLPMGNNKITGLAAGTLPGDGVPLSQLYGFVGQMGASGFRNKLINANFRVNQDGRVPTTTSLAAGEYWLDGWFAGTSGASVSYADDGVDITVTIISGSLCQKIEPFNIEAGPYTLSWSGSANGRLSSGAYAASPASIGNLTAGASPVMEFNAGTLTRVQLEVGSSATPYERRPFGLELSLCQRYYWRGKTPAFSGYAAGSGDIIRCPMTTKVTMRASPTFSIKAGPTYVNVLTGLAFQPSDGNTYTLTVAANGTGPAYSGPEGEYSLSARL